MQNEPEQANTGIEFQTNDHDSDIRAYIDNGEYAVTWTLKRYNELIEVRKFYYEAGLEDEIGGADVFEEDRTVSEYAREELLPDAEDELKKAMDYWT